MEASTRNKGFTIKKYHSDNEVSASGDPKEDCDEQEQSYLLSGIGAQYQNGVAKRNIKMIALQLPNVVTHKLFKELTHE